MTDFLSSPVDWSEIDYNLSNEKVILEQCGELALSFVKAAIKYEQTVAKRQMVRAKLDGIDIGWRCGTAVNEDNQQLLSYAKQKVIKDND